MAATAAIAKTAVTVVSDKRGHDYFGINILLIFDKVYNRKYSGKHEADNYKCRQRNSRL